MNTRNKIVLGTAIGALLVLGTVLAGSAGATGAGFPPSLVGTWQFVMTLRSTGFGSWKQTGNYRYKERHTFMEFDPNGLLWRTMVIESNIRLSKSGNSYDAVGHLELTDISGNVVNFCATFEATRFKP